MSFLLDTNVVSELKKPRPSPTVVQWIDALDEDEIYLSVVTMAELRYGAERLPKSARRRDLEAWIENDLPQRFSGRILPVDERIANLWGELGARADSRGRPISVMDAFLAATAQAYNMKLASQNVQDFAGLVADLVDPWDTP